LIKVLSNTSNCTAELTPGRQILKSSNTFSQEIPMIIRSIFASVVLAASMSAIAAPQWTVLAGNNADDTFLDSTSIDKNGGFIEVDVLRNLDETITLGNDPETGAEMYAHRSVKLTYKVDCKKGAISMSEWTMFDGSFGNGEVVWADKNWGNPVFTAANDEETQDVLRATCPTSTAAR